MMEGMEYIGYSADATTDESYEEAEDVLNTLEVPGLPSHV